MGKGRHLWVLSRTPKDTESKEDPLVSLIVLNGVSRQRSLSTHPSRTLRVSFTGYLSPVVTEGHVSSSSTIPVPPGKSGCGGKSPRRTSESVVDPTNDPSERVDGVDTSHWRKDRGEDGRDSGTVLITCAHNQVKV